MSPACRLLTPLRRPPTPSALFERLAPRPVPLFAALSVSGCSLADRDGDGYGPFSDCDDRDPGIHAAAAEQCDGLDNDCDDAVDEELEATHHYYPDGDRDGYGSGSRVDAACAPGFTVITGDCDDLNPDRYPGAKDPAGDGVDQDCAGADGAQPSVGLEESVYDSIQAAIDAARDGQTVWVGPGLYRESRISFAGRRITVASVRGAHSTVIDARGDGRVVTFDSGEGPESVLSGVTVQGGGATSGAGILVQEASPTLRGLIIRENYAVLRGGGLMLENSDATVNDTTVEHNRVGELGGYFSFLYQPTETVLEGGGLFIRGGAPRFLRLRVERNTARRETFGESRGGGIFVVESEPGFSQCQIRRNQAMWGGGIFLKDADGATLDHCVVVENLDDGLALLRSDAQVSHTLIAHNIGFDDPDAAPEDELPMLDYGSDYVVESESRVNVNVLSSGPVLEHCVLLGATNGIFATGSNALPVHLRHAWLGPHDGYAR